MLEAEQRVFPRFQPKGVLANISVELPPPSGERLTVEGEVLDLSYNGVKIRLLKPLKKDINHCAIKIEIIMPRTSVPICIHGILKHIKQQCEYGLQFTDVDPDADIDVDELMFECIKLANRPLQL